MGNTEEYKWLGRFMEIASTAILKAHYEFINWSIGQSGAKPKESIFNSNIRGIELADEPTICSLISIEALKSPLFSGDFDSSDETKSNPKYYRVNRELKYLDGKRVDLVVQRFEPSSTDEVDKKFHPVYIEAKRAELYSISNISTGEIKQPVKSQDQEIFNDILKLGKESSDVHKYVLVWGVYEKTKKNDTSKNYLPNELINILKNKDKDKKYNEFIRWLPISWEEANIKEPPDGITKWIWILMLEVDPVPVEDETSKQNTLSAD